MSLFNAEMFDSVLFNGGTTDDSGAAPQPVSSDMTYYMDVFVHSSGVMSRTIRNAATFSLPVVGVSGTTTTFLLRTASKYHFHPNF